MMELKLNKESKLSFEMNIEGNKETPKARLMFEMEDGLELALKGKITEGTIEVEIPSLMDLKEKLSGDNVRGYLEVMVDGNYFIPWDETFSLKAPVTVQAESTGITSETNEIKITFNASFMHRQIIGDFGNSDFNSDRAQSLYLSQSFASVSPILPLSA